MGLSFFTRNPKITSSGHAHDHVTGKEKAYKRLFLSLFAHTALLNDRNLIFYLPMHRFETFLENSIFTGHLKFRNCYSFLRKA